jgi:hypothetical protein
MSVGVAGSNRKQPEPGATERTRAKTRAGLGARGRGSGHPVAWGLDTTSLRRGPPSVVDLEVTRGFRWGISMSSSGESYVNVITGAELRGRTSERPPEAAPGRLGAHRARCGSRRSIRADMRCGHDGKRRRSGLSFCARVCARSRIRLAAPAAAHSRAPNTHRPILATSPNRSSVPVTTHRDFLDGPRSPHSTKTDGVNYRPELTVYSIPEAVEIIRRFD